MSKARDLANSAAAFASVSATELGYVDGVTSAIQTQLDAKAPSSTAATLTGTQTLTNKTIDTASNTITGAVTLTGTQTLTNKTLTNPVISSVINNTLTSTTGDIIYASAANTPARLGIGSSAQVLTVASGVPSWATPASGSTFVGATIFNESGLSTANSTTTTMTFPTETIDTNTFHDTSTNTSRLTIPSGKAGYYEVSYNIMYEGQNSPATTLFFLINVNGSQVVNYKGHSPAGAGEQNFPCSRILNLAVGDYVELKVWQNSGITRLFYCNSSQAQASIKYLGA